MQQHVSNPGIREGGQQVKIQLFQNKFMLLIIFNKMEHSAPCMHISSPYKHPQPVGWIKRQMNILNVVMLHIKLSGKKYGLT